MRVLCICLLGGGGGCTYPFKGPETENIEPGLP